MTDDTGSDMSGQWTGSYAGSEAGAIVMELESAQGRYVGHTYLFPDDASKPATVAFLRSPDLAPAQRLQTIWVRPFRPVEKRFLEPRELADAFPLIEFPDRADIELRLDADLLNVTWRTPVGSHGSASIERGRADQPSELEAVSLGWREFKEEALRNLEQRSASLAYRGQSTSTRRLRTSFHRTRRKDVMLLVEYDLDALQASMITRTKHLFDLTDNKQRVALWHLAQHHGYPTPLLDWTYSPFVAAYFAFQGAHRHSASQSVRLYRFNRTEWERDHLPVTTETLTPPHYSFVEPYAIANDRAAPQQALSALTNVDDIEGFVRSREVGTSKRYLEAFDMPASERLGVLRELASMGITEGSLFPGLGGICADLRTRMFGIEP